MNEDDAISRLYELMHGDAPPQAIVDLATEATRAFPLSAELWCMLGDALQLAADLPATGLPAAALKCYERAIELDPASVEALNAKAAFLDVAHDNFPAAEALYRRALALGGDVDTYTGLARVLAQSGECQAALDLLDERCCPFASDDSVIVMRREIAGGTWG